MKFACVIFLTLLAIAVAKRCTNKRINSKLICYYSDVTDIDTCMCTHIILPANSDLQTIEAVQEKFRGGSVLLTVHQFNEDLVNILKNSKIDGLEINLKKLDDKDDVPDFISTVKSKLGSDLYFAVSIPSKAEILAKYYDLKALTKHADLFILQTGFLGASQNVTFHPSRLSGLWDMQNTDSVVDLINGMGAPLSKLVITSPVQAFQFVLQNEAHTAPGSPALEIKSLTRDQLCSKMTKDSNWTLEREQDQAGPYIFRKNKWIAFDDATSMDIKAKYSRVRGLAGLALKDLSQDGGEKCGGSLLKSAYNGLSKQTRAPRGAVLQSLEREILETPARPLDTVQVSPYRISRVIDVEGNVHSIRQDTRTEFECARQGYYVHPRSCGRFYRCVKFDQLSDDFNVFEFDCPAGLSFDSRYEVCVWPGSLPYSSACSGSSEIAPVPRSRYVCPGEEGYYADPENCRWFFACLDHGKSPLSAYEFRCPFGLVFDESRLVCEWPWLVPRCGSGGAVGFEYSSHGAFGGARLETYNGLGALGVVNLGGLSGTIVEPQAKIYTSVSGGGTGAFHGHGGLQGAGLAHGGVNLGYTGSAHLTTGGLSRHGSSAFHGTGSQIGLVNTGQTVIHGAGATGIHSGAAIDDQSLNTGHAYLGNGQASLHSTSGALNSGAVINHGISGAAFGSGATQGASYQSNINLQGGSAFNQGRITTGDAYGSRINLVGDGISGVKTANVINHGVTLQQPGVVLSSSGAHGQHDSSSYQYQADLAQSIHGNTGGQRTVVTAAPVEKIHIVGGFSAVGTGGLKSGIEVSQNGLDFNNLAHVTPAPPVSVSTVSVVSPSPVVAVAAAPVPVVKSDSETYEGGVVANVPELQYKIVTPNSNDVYYESDFKANADYSFSRGASGFSNISHNLINYVSSTPSPVAVGTINFNTPAASFVQVSTVKPLVALERQSVVHGGYNYPKPAIAFAEEPIRTLQGAGVSSFSFTKHASGDKLLAANTYTAVTPTIALHAEQPAAVVSSYGFQNSLASNSEGYSYPKPTIAFEEKPVQIVQPVQPAVVSSFSINSIQKPVAVAQPAVVSGYSFQNHAKSGSYQYTNPTLAVKTVQPVVSVTPIVPIVQNNVQPAVVNSYSSFQNHARNDDYQYTNTAGALKTIQPVVSVTPTVPVIQQNIQPAGGFSYSFQTHADNEGYQYTKPAVERVVSVTPVVPVIQHQVQPAVVSSFNFQNLARNENYKQQSVASVTPVTTVIKNTLQQQPAVVSSFSFQNNFGSKQTGSIVPVTPATPIAQHNIQPVQPAVVSSYSFQNVADNEDYKYTKQAIPVVRPTVPNTGSFSFQTVVGNEGYKYNQQETPLQPVQSVVSVTPVTPVIQHQPAVVSSYSFHNAANRDYKYSSQPVQPTVVSSYSFGSAVDNENYKYTKQTVPVQPFVSVTPVVPTVQHRPAVISSYSFQNDHAFSKQVLPVQPVVSVTPTVPVIEERIHPVVSSFSFQNPTNRGGYKYNQQPFQSVVSVTPVVPIVHENVQPVQPAVVSSYNFQNLARNEDYQFSKQTVHAQPVVSVTPTVPIVKEVVQPAVPAVVSSYSFSSVIGNQDYDNGKQITFESKPIQPAVVPSFNIQKSTEKETFNEGYLYSKPSIAFEENPLPSIVPVVSATPIVPVVEKRVQPVAPAVVSSYSFQNSAVDKNENYNFVKNQIQPFQPIQPAVVSSFNIHNSAESNGFSYTKSDTIHQERPLQPLRPAVVNSYSFTQSTENPIVAVTPIVPVIQQNVQPVIVHPQPSPAPILNQKTLISSGNFGEKLSISSFQRPVTIEDRGNRQNTVISAGYNYPKPSISFNEGPLISYENRQPVQEVPFVAKKAYVTGQQQSKIDTIGYNYPKPAIAFNEGPAIAQTYSTPFATSTVKYEQVSVPVNPFQQYIQPYRGSVKTSPSRGRTFIENYSYSPSKPDIFISTPTPFKSRGQARVNVDTYDENLYVSTPRPTYSSTVASVLASKSQPLGQYEFYDSRLQSTPRPLLQSTIVSTVPYVTSTQSTPINKVSFGSFNDEYQVKVAIPTPQPTVILPTAQSYVDDSIAVSTPARTYLPVVAEEYVVTPKPKTYVKVNDFHPFLPAKLGAQCTCRSNTVTLRRKPIVVAAPAYSSDDNDGYIVKPNNIQQSSPPIHKGRVVQENYAYQPQISLDATPTPVVFIKGTTNAILPAPAPGLPVRKRVRVRPVTTPATVFSSELLGAPVTHAPEVFLRTTITPTVAAYKEAESRPSPDQAYGIAGKNINLVQSSVKSRVSESLSSNTFDRYGPGGWRSRQETLQGTIDCQRAGLFRHPEQCNKFYACRWDCTKKRFTLHVFNCPVHLTFDSNSGACNWPSQGPACAGNTLLPNE